MSLNTHRTASTTRSPRGCGGAHGRHHPAGRRLHGEERHLREHGGAEPAHPGGGHAPRHGPGGLEDHPGRVRGSPHTLRYTPMWPLVTWLTFLFSFFFVFFLFRFLFLFFFCFFWGLWSFSECGDAKRQLAPSLLLRRRAWHVPLTAVHSDVFAWDDGSFPQLPRCPATMFPLLPLFNERSLLCTAGIYTNTHIYIYVRIYIWLQNSSGTLFRMTFYSHLANSYVSTLFLLSKITSFRPRHDGSCVNHLVDVLLLWVVCFAQSFYLWRDH